MASCRTKRRECYTFWHDKSARAAAIAEAATGKCGWWAHPRRVRNSRHEKKKIKWTEYALYQDDEIAPKQR
eukprot:scaffold5357_cov208-Amphora_coffeaeformis.AAC.17